MLGQPLAVCCPPGCRAQWTAADSSATPVRAGAAGFFSAGGLGRLRRHGADIEHPGGRRLLVFRPISARSFATVFPAACSRPRALPAERVLRKPPPVVIGWLLLRQSARKPAPAEQTSGGRSASLIGHCSHPPPGCCATATAVICPWPGVVGEADSGAPGRTHPLHDGLNRGRAGFLLWRNRCSPANPPPWPRASGDECDRRLASTAAAAHFSLHPHRRRHLGWPRSFETGAFRPRARAPRLQKTGGSGCRAGSFSRW